MRIALGQLWQETNTFNRNPTTLDDFARWGMADGDAVVGGYGSTGELGGFLDGVLDWESDAEFFGLARFACWPWGRIDEATWRHIRARFSERLISAGPLDAVFLALHGAMAAEGEPDVTGAILELVREELGPTVPIVGTLDLHANITPRMIDNADVLVGYHACPHLDSFETGQRAADALEALREQYPRISRDSRRLATIHRKIPMITAAENHNTFTGPPAPLYETLKEWEADREVLSAGLYMAMPWFDVPRLGWSITVTTTGSEGKWRRHIDDLAERCWMRRDAISRVVRFSEKDVVDRALAAEGHPAVIGDGADATNSGSPGDQTSLLREFLRRETIPHGALTFLVDPQAVAKARQVGEGGEFDAAIGGCFAPEHGDPLPFRGKVERIVRLEFTLDGHIGRNLPIRMGIGAVVRSGDVTVLLCEKTGPGSTPRLYETAGLDPREFGIVVAKSPAGFRAEYEPFASALLMLDGPGCASPHFQKLNYYDVNRPLWPLDRIDRPEQAGWC